MINNTLKYFLFSDTHYLMGETNSKYKVANTRDYFEQNKEQLKLCDVIIHGGDVFHKAASFSSQATTEVMLLFMDIASFCIKYDIVFIVVDGTNSHDMKQTLWLSGLSKLNKGLQLYYVDIIKVINVKGVDILIVPDNIAANADLLLKEIHKTLNGLKIPMAVMHSEMDFNLPPVAQGHNTVNTKLLSTYIMDNGIVYNGHIHKRAFHSVGLVEFSTIGSLDRGSFGEEHSVGAIFGQYDGTTHEYRHVDNDFALVYKTFECPDDESFKQTYNDVIKFIKATYKKRKQVINIRVKTIKKSSVNDQFKTIRVDADFKLKLTHPWDKIKSYDEVNKEVVVDEVIPELDHQFVSNVLKDKVSKSTLKDVLSKVF